MAYDDNSALNKLLVKVGTGWLVRVGVWEDCGGVEIPGCEGLAWSAARGRETDVDINWAFLFREERSADSALRIIRDTFVEVRSAELDDIKTDGRFVVATGRVDEDDWSSVALALSVDSTGKFAPTPTVIGQGASGLMGRVQEQAPIFVSVRAGSHHTCGVRTDGAVACWGNDEYGQSSTPTGSFVSVSAGNNYTCGARQDGTVACWGVRRR